MSLTLQYTGQTSIPVEIEGLTPDAVRDWSLAEVERFEIFHGNQKLPLAELFRVTGDPSDGRFDFEGDLSGVHWIGANMKSGAIHIHGDAGRHLGSEMAGGEMHVHGDAGDWVGGEMRGGLIHVHGSAGDSVGAAYHGSPRGMTGGVLLVDGDAGAEIGRAMRRGLIAVGGAAGDLAALNMIAGTLLVFGACGARPAAGMRRGTVGLFGAERPTLLPTFRRACRMRPTVLNLILRELRDHDFPRGDFPPPTDFDLYHGDFLALGKGEIFLPAA